MRTPTCIGRARRAQARYGVWTENIRLSYFSFVYLYNISRLLYYPTIVTFIYASVAYIILFKQVSNAEGSELTCSERVIQSLHFRSQNWAQFNWKPNSAAIGQIIVKNAQKPG